MKVWLVHESKLDAEDYEQTTDFVLSDESKVNEILNSGDDSFTVKEIELDVFNRVLYTMGCFDIVLKGENNTEYDIKRYSTYNTYYASDTQEFIGYAYHSNCFNNTHIRCCLGYPKSKFVDIPNQEEFFTNKLHAMLVVKDGELYFGDSSETNQLGNS